MSFPQDTANKAKRIRILGALYADGVWRNTAWVCVLWAIGLLLVTVFTRWNGESLVFCGVQHDSPLYSGNRVSALYVLIGEMFSWAWLLSSLLYVLPSVLLPLATSHSTSHILWVRLTPATSGELAVARLDRVVRAVILLWSISTMWVVTCCIYHSLPFGPGLILTLGFAAHVVLSAGIVLVGCLGASSDKPRDVTELVALLVPPLSCVAFLAFPQAFMDEWTKWWPYACPFAYPLNHNANHFLASFILGVLLIIVYIFFRRGQMVPLGVSSTTEGA